MYIPAQLGTLDTRSTKTFFFYKIDFDSQRVLRRRTAEVMESRKKQKWSFEQKLKLGASIET